MKKTMTAAVLSLAMALTPALLSAQENAKQKAVDQSIAALKAASAYQVDPSAESGKTSAAAEKSFDQLIAGTSQKGSETAVVVPSSKDSAKYGASLLKTGNNEIANASTAGKNTPARHVLGALGGAGLFAAGGVIVGSFVGGCIGAAGRAGAGQEALRGLKLGAEIGAGSGAVFGAIVGIEPQN